METENGKWVRGERKYARENHISKECIFYQLLRADPVLEFILHYFLVQGVKHIVRFLNR